MKRKVNSRFSGRGYRFIRTVSVTLAAVLLAASVSYSAAETLGFGFVNNTDVALRRGMNGKAVTRLPKDTCVWIRDTGKDSKGVLWYEITAGIHTADSTNVDYSGWMKAEFVDAGDRVWHDAVSVKASHSGMIVLCKDGRVVSAGRQMPPADGSDRTNMRIWNDSLRDIVQVAVCEGGLIYSALDSTGAYHDFSYSPGGIGKNRLRLIGGKMWVYGITEDYRLVTGDHEADLRWVWPHQPGAEELSHAVSIEANPCRILLLMDDGRVFASEDESRDTEPDWADWTDIVSLEASSAVFSAGGEYHTAYAAVRRNGTVLAAPEELARATKDWTEMRKIVIGGRWVLGLKRDGTVLSAGFAGETPPDVSGWKEITDIGTGYDYCVGIQSDGRVVFAGDYTFMREGHVRK